MFFFGCTIFIRSKKCLYCQKYKNKTILNHKALKTLVLNFLGFCSDFVGCPLIFLFSVRQAWKAQLTPVMSVWRVIFFHFKKTQSYIWFCSLHEGRASFCGWHFPRKTWGFLWFYFIQCLTCFLFCWSLLSTMCLVINAVSANMGKVYSISLFGNVLCFGDFNV